MLDVVILVIVLVAALLGLAVIIARYIRGTDTPRATVGVPTPMPFMLPDAHHAGLVVLPEQGGPLAPGGEFQIAGVRSQVDLMQLPKGAITSYFGAKSDAWHIKRATEAVDARTQLLEAARRLKDAEAEFLDEEREREEDRDWRHEWEEGRRDVHRAEVKTSKALLDAEQAQHEVKAATLRGQLASAKGER